MVGEVGEECGGAGAPGVGGGAGDSANTVGDPDDAALEDAIAAAVGADPARRGADKLCSTLFKGSVFFIRRECPKDMMIFVITSFGGDVAWDGEGSPHDASDGGITHVVADRPMDGKMAPNREYVVPQWVVDYAIVHELAHLVEAHHNERFWAWVDNYPQAERAKGYLMGWSAARAGPDEPDEPD